MRPLQARQRGAIEPAGTCRSCKLAGRNVSPSKNARSSGHFALLPALGLKLNLARPHTTPGQIRHLVNNAVRRRARKRHVPEHNGRDSLRHKVQRSAPRIKRLSWLSGASRGGVRRTGDERHVLNVLGVCLGHILQLRLDLGRPQQRLVHHTERGWAERRRARERRRQHMVRRHTQTYRWGTAR